MKRQGSLFEAVADYHNIRLAFLKALKGNRSSPGAAAFCRDTDRNLASIRDKLRTLNCGWGGYRSFPIKDPKPRVISAAPFEQRVMHHAIMNVLDPFFESPMIYHSYACRKGKGTHAAVMHAFKQCKKNGRFLKLDIRGYFNSVDHEVLRGLLRRRFKDIRVLALLDGIISSYETSPGKGIPIGNLTSQYFANLYLADMDHYILERLGPRGYCRYMDDFVTWASSQEELKKIYENAGNYAAGKLCLTLKTPVFGKTSGGLPFLGFLIKDTGIYLLQKSKERARAGMALITAQLNAGQISPEKASERARSVLSAADLARTHRFRQGLLGKLPVSEQTI